MWESHSDLNRVYTVNCDSDVGGGDSEERSTADRRAGVFFLWRRRSQDQPMPASERGLSFSTDGLVDEYGQWTVPSYKNEPEISGGAGKQAAVRAGGSASRTSGDQSSTDPGGGFRRNKQRKSHWRTPGENSKRGHWEADSQEFPSLEAQGTAGNIKGSAGPSTAEVDRRPTGPPTPVLRNLDRGMRPAKDIQSVPKGNSNTRTRGVQKTIVTPLSALAENFIPRKTSGKQSTPQVPTDNELDRSFAKTGSEKKKPLMKV